MSVDFETLNDTGFKFTETSIKFHILSATYGDGYDATARVGSSDGLRAWTVEIAVLPDLEEYSINAGEHGWQTRADYLWDFYCRRMVAANESFWIRDQKDGRSYLVCFVELQLTYGILTSALYTTGVQLRQRRERGVESVSAPRDEVNPDSI